MTSARSDSSQVPAILPPESEWKRILTPALVLYPDVVSANISTTLRLLGGRPDRWRPHVKTAKLEYTMRQLTDSGIENFKCATTLELITACRAGAKNILFAYPCMGRKATRVREIAAAHPAAEISVLVDNAVQIAEWNDSSIGLFIDVNSGMDRTGIDQWNVEGVVALAGQITRSGMRFCGLHYYDGQHSQPRLAVRNTAADAGYRQLMTLVDALRSAGIPVPELVTSGTPTLPSAIHFSGFARAEGVHRISSGTIIYNDLTSLSQLPPEWGYQVAAMVATTVISHPAPDLITCDAGHKTVSADAGFPNSAVLGRPDLEPLRPSEEHLPIRMKAGAPVPAVGEVLHLIPRHICPTVNNFDHAVLVRNGRICGVAPVTARGREAPFLEETTGTITL